MTVNAIRVLIIDDEAPARRALELLLEELAHVTIVDSVGDGLEALSVLAETNVDVLLVDIQMPNLSGLELAARLVPAACPVIVFVTAFANFAFAAFDIGAADYLLKPVAPASLARALDRARQRLDNANGVAGCALAATMRSVNQIQDGLDDHIWVDTLKGRERIPLERIERFAAEGDYVRAHTKDRDYLISGTLSALARNLPTAHYIRVHRSTVVRVSSVQRVESDGSGALHLILESGSNVRVGKRVRSEVQGRFQSRWAAT